MADCPLIIQIERTSDRVGRPARIVARPCHLAADGLLSRTITDAMSISTLEPFAEATLIERVVEQYHPTLLRIAPSRRHLVEKFTSRRAIDALFQRVVTRDETSITVPLTGYAGPAALTIRAVDRRMVLMTPIVAWLLKRSSDAIPQAIMSLKAGTLFHQWIEGNFIDLPDPSLSDLEAQRIIGDAFRERVNPALENPLVTGINDPILKAEPIVESGSIEDLVGHTRALMTLLTPEEMSPAAILYLAHQKWQDSDLAIDDSLDKRRMKAAHDIFGLIKDRNRVLAPQIRFDDIGSPARFASYRRVQECINVGHQDGIPSAHERLAAASLLTETYGEAFSKIYDAL